MPGTWFDIVVPTVGRPSLGRLLDALSEGRGPAPGRLYLVDDRPARRGPIPVKVPVRLGARLSILATGGRGPAAARNAGWRASSARWIAFLDDDVVPAPDWAERLQADLQDLPADVAGSQGSVVVPLPPRPPTDWERNVQGLERARWATANMAYRREALQAVGGFDERFPNAYREDADLGLRVTGAGYRIVAGRRNVLHPVPPADRWVSVRLQRGNADDALMRAVHGRDWRERAGAFAGRRRRHLAVTGAAALGVFGVLGRRRVVGAAAAAAWVAGTAELAWARIRPGPRTPEEIATMVLTSSILPAAASYHWMAGTLRARHLAGAAGPRRNQPP
jgi:hypothetical protein